MTLIEMIISIFIFALMGGLLILVGTHIDATSRAANNLKNKVVGESQSALGVVVVFEKNILQIFGYNRFNITERQALHIMNGSIYDFDLALREPVSLCIAGIYRFFWHIKAYKPWIRALGPVNGRCAKSHNKTQHSCGLV